MYNYLISFILVFSTSFLGSLFTSKSVNSPWYSCIKPDITPPSYIFPIVWTTLYILIFLGYSYSLNKGYSSINLLTFISLIFNVLWCYFYFDRKDLYTAFYIIIAMIILASLIVYSSLLKKDYYLASIYTPYLLWISFASILNFLSLSKKC